MGCNGSSSLLSNSKFFITHRWTNADAFKNFIRWILQAGGFFRFFTSFRISSMTSSACWSVVAFFSFSTKFPVLAGVTKIRNVILPGSTCFFVT